MDAWLRLAIPVSVVQVDNSDTRRHGGTGPGLYIVRELAQRMGGDVAVRSTPAAGSTFEVTLRLDVATAMEGAAQPPESAPASAMGAPAAGATG